MPSLAWLNKLLDVISRRQNGHGISLAFPIEKHLTHCRLMATERSEQKGLCPPFPQDSIEKAASSKDQCENSAGDSFLTVFWTDTSISRRIPILPLLLPASFKNNETIGRQIGLKPPFNTRDGRPCVANVLSTEYGCIAIKNLFESGGGNL